jgi:hypothetical protein
VLHDKSIQQCCTALALDPYPFRLLLRSHKLRLRWIKQVFTHRDPITSFIHALGDFFLPYRLS